MAYSEIKVIAGGLAHIPIIIGFFYFVQSKIFAKKIDGSATPSQDKTKNPSSS